MELTSAMRQQRVKLIEAIVANNPGVPYTDAVEAGCALFDGIIEAAERRVQKARDAGDQAVTDLAAMTAEQFEAEFAARLAEGGTAAGLDSPIWR